MGRYKIYTGSIQISKHQAYQTANGNIVRGNKIEFLNIFFLRKYVIFTIYI